VDAPEVEEPPGAPDWLVTFSDLVSLLVTLFIMMLTFTTQETDDLTEIMNILKGGFGVQTAKDKPDLVRKIQESNRTENGVTVPGLMTDTDLEDSVKELRTFYLEQEEIDGGVKIIPDIVNSFPSGSDRPSNELERECRRLATKLRVHPDRLFTIVGHADTETDLVSDVGDYDILALSRARRIARIMGLARLPLGRVSIISHADRNPRTAGRTVLDRAKNRRVEIWVTMPRSRGK